MSIQLLLEPESKNNKSLDLYCNSIDASELKIDDLTTFNLNVEGDLIVKNTVYPTVVPLGNAVSMMTGHFSGLSYAVSPYVFLNSLPQTYTLGAVAQTVGGVGTATKGVSTAYIAICDNSLYSYDFTFEFSSGATGIVNAYLVLQNNSILNITQSIPLGTSNYYRVFGQFQSFGGWGTDSCDLTATLQAEYQDNSTPLKETLYTTSKSGINSVPYLNSSLISVEVKLSSNVPITLIRTIGNIKCEYNDFTQNGPF
jgi:hypothetical protein